jgi:hypothetical protein
MRLAMPLPQYVASFSKRVLVSGSVRGRMLLVLEGDLDCVFACECGG